MDYLCGTRMPVERSHIFNISAFVETRAYGRQKKNDSQIPVIMHYEIHQGQSEPKITQPSHTVTKYVS